MEHINNKNYAFISYSHKDSELVTRVVEAMRESGINAWYDDGIAAGSEWLDTLQRKILGCSCFVAFVSKNFVDSPNCRGEINYAASKDKDILVVLLDNAELEYGLELLISPRQHLYLDNQNDYASFIFEFLKAEILVPCRQKQIESYDVLEEIAQKFAKQSISGDDDSTGITRPSNADVSREKNLFIKARSDGPHAISFVNSKPTNVNNGSIDDSYFSNEIDISKFSVIQFQCKLYHAETTDVTKNVGVRILDARDRPVFESIFPYDFKSGESSFNINWKIKGDDGLNYPLGRYCALIWIDDSRVFDYEFEIINTVTPQIINKSRIESLKESLCYHALFKTKLMQWCASLLFILLSIGGNETGLVITFFASLILQINLYKETRKQLKLSRILSFIVVFLLGFVYGIYLLIKRQMNSAGYKERLEELKRLESTME